MNPEIHASLRTSVCALIGELGTMLGHLETAAEFSSIEEDPENVRAEALADLLGAAANAAAGAAQRAYELAEDTAQLEHAALQAAGGITHEPDEAEGDR